MSRSRNIKPGLWLNEELAEISIPARYLFPALWCLADKEGRLEYRPKKIKIEVYPYDEIDIIPLVAELHGKKFISVYENEGLFYVQINNFTKHQNPHPKEKSNGYPAPVNICNYDGNLKQFNYTAGNLILPFPSSSLIPSFLIPESMNPNDSPDGESCPAEAEPISMVPEIINDTPKHSLKKQNALEVFEYWKSTLNHERAKMDKKREQKIKDRLNDGYSVEDLIDAIDGCKLSPHHQGANEHGVKYDDIELICRDASRVDKFIKLKKEGVQKQCVQPRNVKDALTVERNSMASILNEKRRREQDAAAANQGYGVGTALRIEHQVPRDKIHGGTD